MTPDSFTPQGSLPDEPSSATQDLLVGLDQVLITDELMRRPKRSPDYETEAQMLAALALALSVDTGSTLQKMVELIVEHRMADSVGISLLESDAGLPQLRWAALAGAWAAHLGGTMPFDASPCGVVVERNGPLLFSRPHRHFPAARVEPLIHEILLVPFHVHDKPVGTLWLITHDAQRSFDGEDLRLLTRLARFASVAHQMSTALDEARTARRLLEQQVTQRTSELTEANAALRENEERQTFLLDLSDALRELSDPAEITRIVTYRLGEWLRASRVCYGEIKGRTLRILRDHVRGVDSAVGEQSLEWFDESFLASYRPGSIITVSDITTDPRLNEANRAELQGRSVVAFADYGLMSEGQRVAILAVQQAAPRVWSSNEHNLIRETGERVRVALQRAHAEAAVRESQTRLAAAFNSVPVGIAIINMAGRVVFSNILYQRFLPTGIMPSRDPERVGRWRAWSLEGRLLTPEEFPGVRALDGESVVPGQEMLFTDDAGKEIWTSVAMVPTRDIDNQVTGMVSVISDIDTEKRSVAALRESEERLRQFGEASQDVLWIRDAETLQWQYLSPAFEAIYGLSRKAALAGDNYRSWQHLIVPEDRAHAIDSIARVARGEQMVFEYRIRRPADGQVRWLRDTDFPMGGDDGKATRIGGVGQDITEAKRIEAALATAEQRQRLLLEGMPQLVWRAVEEGRWTWASPQWIEHTNLSNARSQGHGWLDALHPDDRERALAAWARAPEDELYQIDYRVRDATSGLYHWFQTRGIPVHHADGAILEWLGTSTDIDEQVRAREYLRQAGVELEQRVAERTLELQQALDTLHREMQEHEQAEERLRQSEKLKAVGQLTGGIAHDFNNMLQGITSALALVQARLRQGRLEDAQTYIEPAQKAAERAGALTQRLLAFSRQQTLSPRLINLEDIARGMEDMIRRAVGPAVQVELKSSDGHWRVLCDANQMESALLNLCINARDAMPEGGWLTIGIEERMLSAAELAGFEDLQPGRFVMLSVTDTGTGMPPEVMARAFEPFFTTKSLGQGTGLGLSQIYGFMHQSGGLAQIETALGKGTTVRLALPAQEAEAKDIPGILKNGKTLLLAEDEHDLRRMLGDQLRDLGYGVLEAETGEAALRILHAGHQVDMLVTDVGLRGSMNGRQLAEAVQTHIPMLPVLFITGYASETLFGEDNVLRKPFKPALLALRIIEQLG